MKAVVIGAAGYAGGELLRLLLGHPNLTSVRATSRSAAGSAWSDVHPHLAALTEARFESVSPAAAAAESDIVFLALEHGASSRLAGELLAATRGVVIDIAADFRIQDRAAYARHYGEHPEPAVLARFKYALADLEGEALRGHRALAIPGCFATAAALTMRPLALAAPGAHASLFAVTGSSGAGAQPKDTTHHPRRATNLRAYQPFTHRHQAEIDQCWRAWTGNDDAPRLMTHSGPFVRGIALTLHARGRFEHDGPSMLARAFEGRPFVHRLDAPPALNHVVGTNLALMFAQVSDDGRELMICCAIDNLIKGASGQAVQAMNLSLGLPEDAGLRIAGPFPC